MRQAVIVSAKRKEREGFLSQHQIKPGCGEQTGLDVGRD